jgi:hypothetical protein
MTAGLINFVVDYILSDNLKSITIPSWVDRKYSTDLEADG